MELGSIQYNQYKTPDNFHTRFLKLLMICRITEPLVQISYYRAALNNTLRNQLANSYPMPITLEQYMTRVLEMDHAWHANKHFHLILTINKFPGPGLDGGPLPDWEYLESE